MNDDDDDYIVGLDAFNNKSYKGDDDFESWLTYDAPLTGGSSTYTITDVASGSTITLDTEYNSNHMTDKELEKLKYSMPIDLLIKWFPDKKDELTRSQIDLLSKSGVGF